MTEPSLIKTFVAGGVGGACLVLIGHPLDTIKVMLQTQPKPAPGMPQLYTSAWDCAVKTTRNEGIPGLYRGMLSPLLGATPINAIMFLGYGFGKKIQQSSPSDVLTVPQLGLAGGLSGFIATAVTVPVERVKCVMQVQRSRGGVKTYSNSLVCGIQLYRKGGLRGCLSWDSHHLDEGKSIIFYQESDLDAGLVGASSRDTRYSPGIVLVQSCYNVPGLALYFGSYEVFIRWLTESGRMSRKDLNPVYVMAAGGLAGVVNWCYGIVPDTLKSRIQTVQDGQHKGIFDVYRTLVRSEGYGALFKGIGPVMLRAIPANAACFLGFEVAIRLLDRLFPNI
eukprot:Em0017g60a